MFWKGKAEDRVGLKASTVYLTYYPLCCFGSAFSETLAEPGQTKQKRWFMASFLFAVGLFFGEMDNEIKNKASWAWRCISIIPAFKRQRQEDCKFKASQGALRST
jgi:hypothetical protein